MTSLFDYLVNATMDAIRLRYELKRTDVTLRRFDDIAEITANFETGNRDRQIHIAATIQMDVHQVECEPTPTHPQYHRLEGFWMETHEVYADTREGERKRNYADPTQLIINGLPAVPPPRHIR